MATKVALAAAVALCLLLSAVLYGVMRDVPDPNDRTVAVLRSQTGCVLVLHRVRHEIARNECRSIGLALVQMGER